MKQPTNSKARNINVKLGAFIRTRRSQLGMTQKTLAGILGITAQQVQKYETGANALRVSWIGELNKALQCSLEHFLLLLCRVNQGFLDGSEPSLNEDRKDFSHDETFANTADSQNKSEEHTLEELENFLLQFLSLPLNTRKSLMLLVSECASARKKTRPTGDKEQEVDQEIDEVS